MDETSQEVAGRDITTTGHIDNGDLEPSQDAECIPGKKISSLNETEAEPNVSTNGIDTEEKVDHFDLQDEKLENAKKNYEVGSGDVENLPDGDGLEKKSNESEINNGVGEKEKKEDSCTKVEEDKPLISFDDDDGFEKPKTSVSVPEKCTDNFISLLDQSLSVINTENQNVSEEESKNKSDNVSEDVEMVNISDSNNLDSNLTPEVEKDTLENEEKCDKPEEEKSDDQLKECKNVENSEEDKPMETELVSCDDLVDPSRDGENRENPSLDKQLQVNLFEEMEVDGLNVENDALEGNEKSDALAESEKSDTLAESEKSDTLAESEKSDGLAENERADEKSDLKESEISDDKVGGNNNEEETITPDTNNQKESSSVDEEICIIPDDVSPRTNKEPNKEDGGKDKEEETEKAGEGTISDGDVLVTRRNDKRREYGSRKVKTTSSGTETSKNSISSEVQVEDVSVVEESESRVGGSGDSAKPCAQCKAIKVCKFQITESSQSHNLCSDQCYNAFKENSQPESESNDLQNADPFARKCAECRREVNGDEKCLSWETMDFCNEDCLLHYQNALGAFCANCKENVIPASMGKYCVRFGYDVRQFCSSSCLEEYKKGLKFCSYCQKDISTGTGFLAPVGDQGQFKDFCEQSCMEKYERMGSSAPPPDVIEECAVCSNSKPVRVEVELDSKTQKLCSEPCFAAFKFVNNITDGQCNMCKKYFDRTKKEHHSIYYEDSPLLFCCKTCMNVYILANRKIVPCNRCKVKKYNFDMIKKVNPQGQILMMCSLNCLTLYQKMMQKCECCSRTSQSQYHLTMSDGSIRNFCGYNCVIAYQNQFPNQTISLHEDSIKSPVPIGGPKRVLPRRTQAETPCVPVISSVQSLASTNGQIAPTTPTRVALSASDVNLVPQVAQVAQVSPIAQTITLQSTPVQTAPTPQVYQQIITKPPQPKEVKNKAILCKPYTFTKGVSCRPHPCMKETQTDESLNRKCLIPIPVPIYVPAPMHMFSTPFPVPVPFPLPIPVPIFIPTTRNSAKGIFKEIKKIQEKIPTDPFEAELLMMAEMVAGDKKQDPTDSESDEGNDADEGPDNTFSPETVDTSNTFGDDMLQMALKMASELEEPAVDMESVLTSNTITPTSQPQVDPNKALYAADPDDPDQVPVMMNRGRKRAIRGGRNSSGSNQSKRGRRTSGSVDVPMLPPPEPVAPPRIEVEKPDANMCLKYTFGVNAWRHWVMQKNAELEKAALTNRKIKLFKPELLQLTADELNFSLCLFVKEVRKPNGTEYAPDTIYYLCLGIQQYLFENGRIDNIFTDSYYEKFTDCLDEVAKKFAALYNDSQYIVTRVEEEHLWESKQLGAHSPHVLLSTLMFFNTKHFNLVTVEEHMQLSFSHIMKHWKRNPNAPGVAKVPGSRNVLLRFYPPQSALEANSRKKKVYEQQENEENPLRCPVKLYEFYLSKCPESVKTRNDVFYLLPERSCVPDSPVWYSTMALGKEPLMKMLHRVKMVKEINIALLTC